MAREATRHPLDHGWIMPDGSYVCDGCTVLGLHEHRCHGSDGGPVCTCELCAEPSAEELLVESGLLSLGSRPHRSAAAPGAGVEDRMTVQQRVVRHDHGTYRDGECAACEALADGGQRVEHQFCAGRGVRPDTGEECFCDYGYMVELPEGSTRDYTQPRSQPVTERLGKVAPSSQTRIEISLPDGTHSVIVAQDPRAALARAQSTVELYLQLEVPDVG